MAIALITGSGGLIGSTTARQFAAEGFDIIGIDNNMRAYFFGNEASTAWSVCTLTRDIERYKHYNIDIRDRGRLEMVFREHGSDIEVVVHTAAQPSHDWAAREPFTDFEINAVSTSNLLEFTRIHCPHAVFIFTSTNKVYGDNPNYLPLTELDMRYELEPEHLYAANGIDETMSIDQTKHSLFGASKVAADVLVQEYGRYFGIKSAIFRGGCLTGPGHSGAMLHGFLAYLMKCALTGQHYTVYGYKGKQVRDNIHAEDLVNCFLQFYREPRIAEVYNIGGSRHSNCSVLEAIALCEEITGKKMNWSYTDENRSGDHIWWISDVRRFQHHYPNWSFKYGLQEILAEIYEELLSRERTAEAA